MQPPINASRRTWLGRNAVLLAALCSAPSARLLANAVAPKSAAVGYGPLSPVRDLATDLPLLHLPAGFSYRSLGWVGDPLVDGTPTPGSHDGTGVVAVDGDVITMVRNHEMVTDTGAFGPERLHYDKNAGGGTTTLRFDGKAGRLISAHASLSGTIQNCAGGITPWGTWLSCEEYVHESGEGALDKAFLPLPKLTREHGFVFEVDPAGVNRPEPIEAMGQFRHEAAVVHAPSGAVYLTEDRDPRAGFYRFLPKTPGKLAAGGRLQMLRVAGRPDLRSGIKADETLKVSWVDIAEPGRGSTAGTRDGLGVLAQGMAAGGSAFTRLEGCFATDAAIYFNASNGGDAGCGQVFAYHPDSNILRLIYESPAREILNFPDNICFSPRGSLLLCEDGSREGQYLQGLGLDGGIYPFARGDVYLEDGPHGLNGNFRRSEWTGSCFSPDGKWLFANLQHPGITFAITGPWKDGLI